MAGKFFDQWEVGERITHDIRRTVTETDNLLFSTMTHNPQPLHLDIENRHLLPDIGKRFGVLRNRTRAGQREGGHQGHGGKPAGHRDQLVSPPASTVTARRFLA